jgi:hypothetical protein
MSKILTFKEFTGSRHRDGAHLHEARVGRSNWVKAMAVGLQFKINSISDLIKMTSDPDKKLDLVTDQIRLSSALSALGIATDLNDKSIFKMKVRRR